MEKEPLSFTPHQVSPFEGQFTVSPASRSRGESRDNPLVLEPDRAIRIECWDPVPPDQVVIDSGAFRSWRLSMHGKLVAEVTLGDEASAPPKTVIDLIRWLASCAGRKLMRIDGEWVLE